MIIIAQKAWDRTHPARNIHRTGEMVTLPYVEIDGVRYENVVDASIDLGTDNTFALVHLTFADAAVIRLLDQQGEPLPGLLGLLGVPVP